MIYMETGSHDPTYNLAFEEYCLTHLTDFPEILLLWQNHHSIIIGRYQNAESEVNADAVKELDVNIARRSTGGGAVYHDLGNLNYSFIFPAKDQEIDIGKISQPMIKALQQLGIPAEMQGRNDLAIEGKKISGTAQRMEKGRILHHGTLLFDSDLAMLQRVLKVDDTKYKSKGADSVRSRVSNIKPYVRDGVTLQDFWKQVLEVFRSEGLKEFSLSQSDLIEVERLQRDKYRSWDWVYGSAPAFEYHNTQRFPGGKLEVFFDVVHGRISNCKIQGDFLGIIEIKGLEESLIGIPFQKRDVEAVLHAVELNHYLGKITTSEVLECFFKGAVDAKGLWSK